MMRHTPNIHGIARSQWGSLEELTGAPEFRNWLDREFSEAASEFPDPLARREFMKLMGASLALMGLSACHRPPQQKIVPYLEQPEFLVSGRPLFFATAMPFNGSATGILVESNEGRPTKVEGNSTHPLSLGATSIFEQASILTLYDPDRSKTILHDGQIETWDNLVSAWLTEQERHLYSGGRRFGFSSIQIFHQRWHGKSGNCRSVIRPRSGISGNRSLARRSLKVTEPSSINPLSRSITLVLRM
jgi:MoCo/4Fe-4S cofactor protein with predicted Tat translocation signal